MTSIAELPRESRVEGRSKLALFLSSILAEPLITLYGFIAVILYKDLHATAFEIALLTMLKPMATILSFYWSTASKGRLRANILGAGFLMRAPFLLCPWFDSTYFLIAAAVNYMLFLRAGVPAWMEVLKRTLSRGERTRTFALSSVFGYIEGGLLSLAFGTFLDEHLSLWKWFFVLAAFLGIVASWVQARVPVIEEQVVGREKFCLKKHLLRPWKDSFELLRTKKEFAQFQWSFMICGFAVMLIQPALTLFAVDELDLSYTEIAMGISVAKGLGYVSSSPLWGRFLERVSIERVSRWVFLVVSLFPLCLMFAKWNLAFFYLSYFCYGVGLGGNHLVWNLSGPHFSGKEESTRYTGVGIILAGLRGAVAPPLGGWLSVVWGSMPILGIGGLLCFWSGLRNTKTEKKSFAMN